jgi:hypothetical protein
MNLIRHIPQASMAIPDRSGYVVDDAALERELLLLTDWHTDHLYANERDTAINRPYRGTLVPEPWYGRDARVRSIMLEVNRKLYLEPGSSTRHAGYAQPRELVQVWGAMRGYVFEYLFLSDFQPFLRDQDPLNFDRIDLKTPKTERGKLDKIP